MKAVITLTADASGVSVGVSKAMKSLENLQQGVSQLRSLAVAGILANVFQGLASGAMDELKRLEDLGRTYSAEGMNASNQLAMAQQQSDQTLGQAFGATTAFIDQMKVQALKELTDYLVANKDKIGEAMILVAEFGIAVAKTTAEMLVAFGELATWIHQFMDNPTKALKQAGQSYIDSNPVLSAGQSTGNALMNYTPAGLILQLLQKKLGGD
jgi:hypothetical protein